MDQYKYSLDKSSRKFRCPGCGQKRLVRYIDNQTKEYLSETVGRCDREDRCQYHLTPKQYFTENPEQHTKSFKVPVKNLEENKPVEYLPFEIFDRSVSNHESCDLFPFLEKLFRKDIAKRLCEDYFIGSSRDGKTAFWQADISGKLRQCKLIRYGQDGHRDKTTEIAFAGKKILNNKEANLQQCFFGEYLLSFPENNNKPIAIAESEKSAVIASVYYPEFVWLATGGKSGASWTSANVCKVLKRRKVILFPDLGAHDTWKAKGSLIASVAGCKVATSDILERSASENDKAEGLDLVDYLLRIKDSSGLALSDMNYPVMWDYLKHN